MQKLSDYVMERVAQVGVRHVFLVPGGAAMHLNDSLAGRADLTFVGNFHEYASAIGAEAYSKLAGTLGVAMVTAGPGSTNAVTALASAWVNSAPLLILSGQVKRPDLKSGRAIRQLGLQEVDTTAVVRPLTKYAACITDPQTIRQHLDTALYLAQAGRCGPVWIDIPLDVQAAMIDPSTLPAADNRPAGRTAEGLDSRVRNVIEGLGNAERPILLLGGGIRLAGGTDLVRALLPRLGVPCATTWVGVDLIDDAEPLFAGRPGAFAPRGANFAVQNSDFLLSIGARWDLATTGFAPAKFARAAHRVVVDVDPAELQKLDKAVEETIEADALAFLEALMERLPASWGREKYAPWRRRVQAWRERYPVVTSDKRGLSGAVSTYVLVEALSQRLTSEDVVVQGSAGIHSEIFFMSFAVKQGQRVIADGSLGAMGYGLPASIGACLGASGRRTILVDGDGSIMPQVQELETLRRLNLPIKIVIVRNNGYASIRSSQQRWFNRLIAADTSSGMTFTDIRRLAEAFGVPYFAIAAERELGDVLDRALSQDGPALIDVRVPDEEDRTPRLSNFQRPDGVMVSKPLEDLFPFLPREEFLQNMIVPPLPE